MYIYTYVGSIWIWSAALLCLPPWLGFFSASPETGNFNFALREFLARIIPRCASLLAPLGYSDRKRHNSLGMGGLLAGKRMLLRKARRFFPTQKHCNRRTSYEFRPGMSFFWSAKWLYQHGGHSLPIPWSERLWETATVPYLPAMWFFGWSTSTSSWGSSSTAEAKHVPSFDRGLAVLRGPVRLLSGEQFQWQGSFTLWFQPLNKMLRVNSGE